MGTPKFSSGINRTYFTDLELQSESGDVRFLRHWTGTRWVYNTRWSPLLLVRQDDGTLPADVNRLTDAQIGQMSSGTALPLYIVREGEVYAALSRDPATAVYAHFQQQVIRPQFDDVTAANPQITGYLWEDREGEQIYYDASGRIQWYGKKGYPRIQMGYNAVNDLSQVKDSQGRVLLSLTYEEIPLNERTAYDRTPYRLQQLQDYKGRTVQYQYLAGGKLGSVVDVLGHAWQMQYNDKHFTGYIDPEGRKTTIDIDVEGRLRSYRNSAGVGYSYSYGYDKASARFIVQKKDNNGTITETYYDHTGYVVQKSVNGTVVSQQPQATYSNGTAVTDTSGLTEKYRRVWITSKGAGSCGGSLTTSTEGGDGQLIDEGQALSSGCVPTGVRLYIKERRLRDERGNIQTETYNEHFEHTGTLYADGTSEKSVYKTWPGYGRRLESRTERNGSVTTYGYDSQARLERKTEAVGSEEERTTRYRYNTAGQLQTVTHEGPAGEPDAVWAYTYDDYGNVHTVTDPLDKVTTYSNYDALGNAWTITDANGHVRQRTYDAAGNLLTERNAYDQGSTFTYDKTGYLVSRRSSEGDSYQLVVNADGLPTEIKDSLNHTQKINYDLANRPTVIQDANGALQKLGYDERGRLLRHEDGEGNVTTYGYTGQLLGKVTYPGYSESYQYDKGDRLTQVKTEASNLSYLRSRGYNIPERTETETDSNSKTSTTELDRLGRVVAYTDAANGITRFTYDHRDNLLQVTDPEGRTTTYTYSLRNELLSESKPENPGQPQQYRYDAAGNLLRHINGKGEVQHYVYDQANRLTYQHSFASEALANAWVESPATQTPVKTRQYLYNAKGQFQGYSDNEGSESRTYNAQGRLETVTVNLGGFSKTMAYTYTPTGEIQSYTSPEGQRYEYSYNKNNQITAVAIIGKGIITWSQYQWLEATNISLPGGGSISYSYDGLLRQTGRQLKDPAGNSIASAGYTYDGESNIGKISTEHGVYDYGYDNLYRLTTIDSPVEDTGYEYDGVGNRTQATQTVTTEAEGQTQTATTTAIGDYNDNNQLTTYGKESYSYDANGHTTQRIDIDNDQIRKTTYHYDMEQRLIEVKAGSATANLTPEQLQGKTAQELKTLAAAITPQTIATYAYNGYNQRIRKTTAQGTIWYMYSEQGLAAEYDQQGNLIVEYHYKPQQTWMTQPISQNRNGTFYYYQNDHLGTPQRLLKTSGEVVWEGRYTAFGEVTELRNTIPNPLRFPGQYYDGETHTHYNYHRDYNPALGRYLQADPLGLFDGPNTFVYVYNNPIQYIDPTGEFGGTPQKCAQDPRVYEACQAAGIGTKVPKNKMPNIKKPEKPKQPHMWTCTCRATENQHQKDCDDNTPVQFAFGTATAKKMTDAEREAKKEAKRALGTQAKHDSCVCINSKGDVKRTKGG